MFDIIALIKTAGYAGLAGIIFAETGLFAGFFLPGDSLLFTAGFLASQGFLDIWILLPLCIAAAFAGDNCGYWIGRLMGPKLFAREDSLLFHKDHLKRAEAFYARYGGRAITIARFVPIVRAFAPTLAGVGNMPYRKLLSYSALGVLLWAVGLPLAGYYLGSIIPNVDRYILPIIALIILASVAPIVSHVLRDPEYRAGIKRAVRKLLRREKYDWYSLSHAFVKESFAKAGRPFEMRHLERTEHWVRTLKPDADEALRIAAVAHDIERAGWKPGEEQQKSKTAKGMTDPKDDAEHGRRGADMMRQFLEEKGVPEALVARVASLIGSHEFGGDAERDILRDADSISYLETNYAHHVAHADEFGRENVAKKFAFMFGRIGSERAKEIARPLYEKAMKELESA